MAKRRKAIARAEKCAVKRWVERYLTTYTAILADKDTEIARLVRDNERLASSGPPCGLPCFRLQQEQFARSSVESDLARVTVELDDFKTRYSESMMNGANALCRAEEAEKERDHIRGEWQAATTRNLELRTALAAAENRASGAEAYANSLKPCDARAVADTALGRLVRRMPAGYSLLNSGDHPTTFPWECRDSKGRRVAHNRPEDALSAILPDYCDTDDVAAALRVEDADEAERVAAGLIDRERLDFLDAFAACHGWAGWELRPEGLAMSNAGSGIRQAIDAERERRRAVTASGEDGY